MENQDKKEEQPKVWLPKKDVDTWLELNRKQMEDFERFIMWGKYPEGDRRNEFLKSTDGKI